MEPFYLCSTALFTLSGSAVKVYSFLWMVNGSATGFSYYKRSNIAEACKISESSVVRATRELCKRGLLEIRKRFIGRRQTSNAYILIDNPQLSVGSQFSTQPQIKSETGNYRSKSNSSHKAVQGQLWTFPCKVAALRHTLSANELKVYSYLSYRAGQKGECKPSKKEIATDCGISMSSVWRAVTGLRKAGLLEIQRQTRADAFGNNGTSVNRFILKEHIQVPSSSESDGDNHMERSLISTVTPSPISSATPQRTISRMKVTLKQRKEQIISKLTESILWRPGEKKVFNILTFLQR